MSWHGLLIGLAVLAAVILVARLAREKALSVEDVYSTALWGIVGGIIGARLFHVIDKWSTIYQYNPKQVLYFWEGGLSLYGALIGGLVCLAERRQGREVKGEKCRFRPSQHYIVQPMRPIA